MLSCSICGYFIPGRVCMHNNWKLIIAVIIILIISWLDYQSFMEHHTAVNVTDTTRKIYHLIALAAISVTGIAAWKNISKAVVILWTASYAVLFIFLLITAALNAALHFGEDLLNEVSRLRMLFCSPMPFAFSYLLYKMLNKKNINSSPD
jgi:hypothetical protein